MTSRDNSQCPKCGGTNLAKVLYGEPVMDEALQKEIDEKRIVLGGCCVSDCDPDFLCWDCGYEFGPRVDACIERAEARQQKVKGAEYGAAVGDALGVPYEFMNRDTFECTEMTGGGTHGRPTGTFSDDTSLLLATSASIKEKKKVDVDDMRERFRAWLHGGAYTPDGVVFDVGNATATALDQGFGCDGERSNGNGSLMRITPLAFIAASDDEIRAVSAITHAHWMSTESCVAFVHILRDLIDGKALEDAIAANIPDSKTFAFLRELGDKPREEVHSSGFVLHTLEAALWCALHTDNFSDCVLMAVNLGDDTDTTACVAGALAGAMYGFNGIPQEWVDTLRGKDLIEDCLFL